MGMTIDKAIERLHDIQKCYNDEIAEAMFLGFNDTDNESVDVAIDTMRKYQKIEQIVKEWDDSGLLQNQLYDKLHEVIEDGNDCI